MIKLEHTLSIMTNANLTQTTMQTELTFIQIHKQNRWSQRDDFDIIAYTAGIMMIKNDYNKTVFSKRNNLPNFESWCLVKSSLQGMNLRRKEREIM